MRLPEEQPHFVCGYTAAGIESICTDCLATTPRVKHEADLFQVEREHTSTNVSLRGWRSSGTWGSSGSWRGERAVSVGNSLLSSDYGVFRGISTDRRM